MHLFEWTPDSLIGFVCGLIVAAVIAYVRKLDDKDPRQ